MIKKSITMTQTQEAWIQARLATGQYAPDSEIVREALREKQMRMAERERVRAAFAAAGKSAVSSFGKEDMRAVVKAEMRGDGSL